MSLTLVHENPTEPKQHKYISDSSIYLMVQSNKHNDCARLQSSLTRLHSGLRIVITKLIKLIMFVYKSMNLQLQPNNLYICYAELQPDRHSISINRFTVLRLRYKTVD